MVASCRKCTGGCVIMIPPPLPPPWTRREGGGPDQEVRTVEQREEEEVEQGDNLRHFSPVSPSCLILPKLHGCWALLPQGRSAANPPLISTHGKLANTPRERRTVFSSRSPTVTNRPFVMRVSAFCGRAAVGSLPPTWPLCGRANGDDSLLLFRGSSHIKKKNIGLGGNQKKPPGRNVRAF